MTDNPESLRELLAEDLGLSTGQIEILRMRFGIDMKTDCTLEEVSVHFGITVAEVHELEVYALSKLRYPGIQS